MLAMIAIFSACSRTPDTGTPIITLPPSVTLPAASTTLTPTATEEFQPVCTPPPCAENESYFCADECPGGCGTTCATHTPAAPITEPALPTPMPLEIRFAVIGDFGLAGDPEAEVAALVKGWQPDFILTVGDNNYPDGAAETIDANIGQYYHEYIYPYFGAFGEGAETNRFFPILGNHDYTTDQARPYFDYFELPNNERYYDFVWGPAHFFALNSDPREPDGVGSSSAQAQWLQAHLAASTATWKIVYMHVPPYASTSEEVIDWMRWPFAEWGADIVLAGHDHFYERLEVEGFPYLINGLGGGAIYNFGATHPGSQMRYNADYGALLAEADKNQLTFTFQTRAGEVIDTLQLSQQEAQATSPLPAATAFPDPTRYQWVPAASGLNTPTSLTAPNDGSGRVFLLEQPGTIRILQDGQLLAAPFLDIRAQVGSEGNEQGLLGLAFHPSYAQNELFFVNYTDRDGNTVVSRWQVSADPNLADPASEQVILRVNQPYSNHNGGHIAFGPDGYLYIGLGDGGSAGDPDENGQNTSTLLGKMLRLDVDGGAPYAIPTDNPFANGGGYPEIWAWGLRNPWKFSFDRVTGDLFIGDVGQNQWEEIDFWAATESPGANFGWNFWEGFHPYKGTPPQNSSFTFPIWEYGHDLGCSVTGGISYRGSIAAWQGIYLYGDFCSGNVWGLLRDAAGNWQNTRLFQTDFNITAFGEDQAGEIYLIDRKGTVYQLTQK